MRKIFTTLFSFMLFGLLFAFAGGDSAHAQDRVFHTQPVYNSTGQNGNMVNPGNQTLTANVSSTAGIDTPLCVTEWVNGQAWHRGCVPSVHLGQGHSFSFNVDRNFQGPVTFSYQDPSGMWHQINHANNTTAQYNWNTGTSLAQGSWNQNTGWM